MNDEIIALLIDAIRSTAWAIRADEADRDEMIESAKAKLYEAENLLPGNG